MLADMFPPNECPICFALTPYDAVKAGRHIAWHVQEGHHEAWCPSRKDGECACALIRMRVIVDQAEAEAKA